ncbi:MAG: DNA-directed RNA polymerase subunit beta [Chloroflexi bacterium]|nr:DNA-directed RNA polymerase subunit beta [Chloroflexota bacterium]
MTSRVKNYGHIEVIMDLPPLIEVQLNSYRWLKEEGLAEVFDEISPIVAYNEGMRLYFPGNSPEAQEWGLKFWFKEPKHSVEECLERGLTYARPLWASVLLTGPEVPEPIKQDVFLGDFPEMTERGTFIINGTQRVVVSQLIRSPGAYFEAPLDRISGRRMATAKLIPDRGAWLELETRRSDYIILKFNRRRMVPVTLFLRALAAVDDGLPDSPIKTGTDAELISLFEDVDRDPDRPFIATTIQQEPDLNVDGLSIAEAALIELYKRLRPGEPPTLDNARDFLQTQLFDNRYYDLARVGRYKMNQKFDLHGIVPMEHRALTKWDIVHMVRRLIAINNNIEEPDDIDHLANRRVRTVGELVQTRLRVGFRRMERVIKERMSLRGERERVTPASLINIRPISAVLREFFGSSQLSQFMDQTNPLSELRHKRTLSALGPGGLRRERAGFDVRDVHHSHYGRICPIETPEGPNIGLIGRLATYARVNPYGFIETPYRKVYHELPANDPRLINRRLKQDAVDEQGNVLARAGERVSPDTARLLAEALGEKPLAIVPWVSRDVEYLTADQDDRYYIAQANAPLNEYDEFTSDDIVSRYRGKFHFTHPDNIAYMDVAPNQVVGVSAALIPFLEHDDPTRALMGSNMQNQAVPLVRPEAPMVSTGIERKAAQDSGQVVLAQADGEVISVTGDQIVVREDDGAERTYPLQRFRRSNQSTCIDQRPVVVKGQRVKQGDVLADSSSTEDGDLALGQNVVIAFVSWEGGNFEDAILISERLLQEDKYTSIHIEKYEVEARDTRLGPEEITRDIPNVSEDQLRNLDENGIIRIGAQVEPGDILVGKVSPKGEKELTPEERLLRAIFGEKSRDVRDTSLRMPHGERGTVVDVKVFSREDTRELPAGVEKMVRVMVAQRRKITAGDKMAGRHGNKGVVSKVVPVEDMPFLEDGTPVDIILNPLGVPGRMNIGQVLETHLGWAASRLGFRAIVPVFDSPDEAEVEAELARAWMIDEAWKDITDRAWEWVKEQGYEAEELRDDSEVRHLYLEHYLGERGYDLYEIGSDEVQLRRAVLREWLREYGYDPDLILAFEDMKLSLQEREENNRRAIDAALRLWLKRLGYEDADQIPAEELRQRASQAMLETGRPMPILGKQILRDGFTGEPYERPVTVGVMMVMKLHHLVEDKVHARSTGPYSLITQQPLGGKAQFGGQRFGEMEVWALEAYGAAYALQEMLTIKSDDVQGRLKAYEAIVNGKPIEAPRLPASFKVLVKELQSLGIAVEAETPEGIVTFGKEDRTRHIPIVPGGFLTEDLLSKLKKPGKK